jgi:hypothetical protein
MLLGAANGALGLALVVGVACLVHVLLQLLSSITSCLEICIDMPKAISLWATRKYLVDCI